VARRQRHGGPFSEMGTGGWIRSQRPRRPLETGAAMVRDGPWRVVSAARMVCCLTVGSLSSRKARGRPASRLVSHKRQALGWPGRSETRASGGPIELFAGVKQVGACPPARIGGEQTVMAAGRTQPFSGRLCARSTEQREIRKKWRSDLLKLPSGRRWSLFRRTRCDVLGAFQ
jgi:hypothetical protein